MCYPHLQCFQLGDQCWWMEETQEAQLLISYLKAPLLNGILASVQLRRDDAHGGEHGEASIVNLSLSHLSGVLIEVHGITKVAWLPWLNLVDLI